MHITGYALDYYNAYWGEEGEVHGVINFTESTTSCINVYGPEMYITVHEYVDGEEHDAKVLFGGQVLEEYVLNLDTGQLERLS